MSDKRRGLGRGLGALIPGGAAGQGPSRTGADGRASVPPVMRPSARPVDLFFDQRRDEPSAVAVQEADAPADVPAGDSAAESAVEARLGDLALVRTADPEAVEEPASTPDEEATDDVDALTAQEPAPSAEVVVEGEPTDAAERPAQEDEQPPAEALAVDGLLPVPGVTFAEIPVERISPNPRQPRTVFDEDELAELVHSVREIGVLQPVVVRRAGDDYELIMGERRWRAATEAGLGAVPAIVRETADDDLLRDALLENLHRSQLNPLEEAAAYQQLLEDFGCTHEELAGRIGRSRPQISNTLRLLKLPPLVQRRVAAGVLSAGHARALLSLEDGGAMERLAQRIVAEGLSVRAVEEIIALGEADDTPRRRNPARQQPELEQRASGLADRLDTRVRITMGRTRGRLTVDFAGLEDLDRILALLDAQPEVPVS
ncbi:ParB/RepB/Spo0J family partition protein [Kineococcus sp. SYSU DK004]|uniref:ParB/RepB/Spo0J family partition protein n=1 Tax=Kineococcus sp. SYSU DK004 TaxID=3383125 RepID=UPI003D7E9A32